MLWLYVSSLLGAPALVGGCSDTADRAPIAPPSIEVRDAAGALVSRVVPGRPCRATVEGFELLVGSDPLVAQYGSVRWSGERAANGTTFKKNGAAVARIHANQLFDGEGLPILRVMDDGSIANRAGVIVRRAAAAERGITVGGLTVTGTTSLVLAAMLAATEPAADLRAIVACYLLLPEAN